MEQVRPDMRGISTLLNPQHVDPNIDLKKEEQKVLLKDDDVVSVKSTNDKNLREIYALAEEVGIKIDGLPDHESSCIISSSSSSSSSQAPSGVTVEPTPSYVAPSNFSIPPPRPPCPPPMMQQAPPAETNYPNVYKNFNQKSITEEDNKQTIVQNVMNKFQNNGQTVFSTEAQRDRDNKASKLDQIISLKDSMREEGIDVSNINTPSIDSSIDEIDSILNLLNLKNNRYKYSSIAEEFLSGGAELIESFFDGTRTIPVLNITPDYTGYSNNVNAKLHRLRFETSQVVSSVVEKHEISSSSRIAMELLPSFLLYPRIRHKQKNNKSSKDLTAANPRSAFNNIRNKTDNCITNDIENI